MNYKLLTLFTIFLLPLISAEQVGVIVDFPDGSVHAECLEANGNTNGYDLLNQLSLQTLFSSAGSFGHQLCKINGVGDSVSGTGCSFSGKYWRFLKITNSQWEYLPVGFNGGSSCWNNDLSSFDGHYCTADNEVIGLSYGEFTDPRPKVYSFEDICNPLTLKEVKVYVDDNRESDADEEGGEIEAEPGDEIEFRIELENNYGFNQDLEIEDIEAEITIKDIDGGSDIDEDIDFKDLEVDEDDRETISIVLPLVLEDNDYEVELKITAETSSGVNLEIILNYDLNIDKEKHDLIFSKLRLESEESCPNSNNLIFLEISNTGEKDEEDVKVTIKSDDLDLAFSDTFDIDEGDSDDTYKKNIPFKTPNIIPGDYRIDLTLDYSEVTRQELILTINDCSKNEITPITRNTIPDSDLLSAKQSAPQKTTLETQTFLQNYAIPILLAIFLFFLIVAIIYIISIL